MTHRDVSVSLFGVVAGVILGAGSLAYVQVPLQARTLHDAASVSGTKYTNRMINRKGIPLRPESETTRFPTTVKESSSSSSVMPVTEESTTNCAVAKRTVLMVWQGFNSVVPTNVKNTELHEKMDAIFTAAVDSFCKSNAATTSSASSAATVTDPDAIVPVDNHCEKYPSHTARYTQCVISGQRGRVFP